MNFQQNLYSLFFRHGILIDEIKFFFFLRFYIFSILQFCDKKRLSFTALRMSDAIRVYEETHLINVKFSLKNLKFILTSITFYNWNIYF